MILTVLEKKMKRTVLRRLVPPIMNSSADTPVDASPTLFYAMAIMIVQMGMYMSSFFYGSEFFMVWKTIQRSNNRYEKLS